MPSRSIDKIPTFLLNADDLMIWLIFSFVMNWQIASIEYFQYSSLFFIEFIFFKDESIIIVQIEDISAIDNLEEIFSVSNIDGYIIGPYDLSASMGIPGEFDNPKFIDVVNKIKSTASQCKVCGGIHIIEPKPEELEKRIDDGYRFLAYSLDIRMLDVSCKKGIQHIKELKI